MRDRFQSSGSRRRAVTTVALAVVLLAAGAASPHRALAQAQEPVLNDIPTVVVLQGEPRDANTVVPGPAATEAGAGAPVVVASAPFQATYAPSVPAAAQASFQRAMNNWGAVLNSSVPIRIHVEFVALGGPLSLGFASFRTTANFANAPRPNTFYPMALADALAGTDLFPQFFDIEIDFNTATNWYFGTGTPPSGTTDFESAAMHEIGHGLGFAGSMRVNNGVGSWGTGTPPWPDIFDHFTTDLQRRRLIDTSVYPNPSAALAQALTSNNVYFDSPQTNTSAADRPKLYAPATWVQGASYGHLDEATYPPGNPNSLMTPTLLQTEVVHSPGPVTLCILEALGWSTTQNCPPGGAGTGTTTVSATGLETGQSFTASASGVASPFSPYVLRIASSAAACPTGAAMGSSVVATGAGAIPTTNRTVPTNQTSGTRYLCWVNSGDPTDHTTPVPVTIF